MDSKENNTAQPEGDAAAAAAAAAAKPQQQDDDKAQKQPEAPQQQQQPPSEQQQQQQEEQQQLPPQQHIPQQMLDGLAAGTGAPMMPSVDANGLAQMPNHLANPDAMTGLMPDMGLMANPSLVGMGMPDPSMMMNPMMMANGNGMPIPPPQQQQQLLPPASISADEIALYDRQIRLWGMAAQAKIQSANILLITIKALANEIAKNLVLAGVGSLTLLDGNPVTEADLGAQFFLADDASLVGQNRAQAASVAIQKLNPRVCVHVDAEGVKTKGPSYFAAYDVVIATDLDPDSFNLINTATRLHGRAFYATGSHGLYGFIFSDLIEHEFVIERDAGNVPTAPGPETRTRSVFDVKRRREGPKTVESVAKRELYSTWFLASDLAALPDEYTKSRRRLKGVTPALSCLRALWEFMQINGGRVPSNRDDLKMFTQIATQKHKALSLPSETLRPEFLRSFLQNLGSEIGPVAAVLGGQLAQDVINVLGRTQQPIQNMVIFDGTTMEASMYALHPEGSLGASLLNLGDSMVPQPAAVGMMMPGMDSMPTGLGLDPNAMGALPHHIAMNGMGQDPNVMGGMGVQQDLSGAGVDMSQLNPAPAAPQQPPQEQQDAAPKEGNASGSN